MSPGAMLRKTAAQTVSGKHWTRERIIEQWEIVLARPAPSPIIHEFAREALKLLHADIWREPGADDAG